MPRPTRLVLLSAALAATASCGRDSPPRGPSLGAAQTAARPRPGLTEVGPGDLPRLAVSRSVYVPVYSSVSIQDAGTRSTSP